MDYSGFSEFPFPSVQSFEEQQAERYFLSLEDHEQLSLLNGSNSFQEFLGRIQLKMQTTSSQ